MNVKEWSQSLRDLARRGGQRVVAVQSGRHEASGWIWDSTHVVTIEHVLSSRGETWVSTPDGQRLQAHLVGASPGLDLALLRLESEVAVVALPSRNPESLEPGDFALALARSAGDGLGVSAGVIACRSGAWTSCRGGRAEHFLQPDLRLYPGYSGGPLLDAEGNWLGINSGGLSRNQPITLSVPTVAEVVERLLQGQLEPAYLGVGLHTVPLPPAWEERWQLEVGAMVTRLELDSPADRAGILLGDILVRLGQVATGGTAGALEELHRLQAGQTVTSQWIRAGQEIEVNIELGRRPAGDCGES